MNHSSTMALLLLLLASLNLLTFPNASADTPIDEQQAADPNGRVEISNLSGEIVIEGWDRAAVAVTGTLGKNVERLEFTRDADLTVVEVVYPSGPANSGGSDLVIRLPVGSALEVKGVSADIEVSGVSGRQRLRSVSGDVRTEVFAADVEAETVSGDVFATGHDEQGHTSLTTVSGRIETTAVSGELDASTVSGGIDAETGLLDRGRLKTTNGRITLDGGLASGGRLDLATTNGGIELMLDHDRDLDVDAQTFNGKIDNCFGQVPDRSRYTPERTLQFREGAANRTVRIRTMNGPIDICSEARSE